MVAVGGWKWLGGKPVAGGPLGGLKLGGPPGGGPGIFDGGPSCFPLKVGGGPENLGAPENGGLLII